MKISIITVCYNSSTTIADTLDSVARQTYPNIEHIVVDGASTDTTVMQIREHGSHVAKLISEPDAGIYDAMNKGISAATGDWIGFLNADDVFADSTCVDNIAARVANGHVDAVYGDLMYVREDDTNVVVRLWRSGDFRPNRLRFGWMPPHPTFYVSRQLLEKVGRFNTGFRIAADYDFILRCLTTTTIQVAYIPKVLVRMRLGGASNRSFKAIIQKSREDLSAMRQSGVGGIAALLSKNLRKIPQFIFRR